MENPHNFVQELKNLPSHQKHALSDLVISLDLMQSAVQALPETSEYAKVKYCNLLIQSDFSVLLDQFSV